MRNHFLVLGWNDKATRAIRNFRLDPRFADSEVVIVAELREKPIDDDDIRFVSGPPDKIQVLEEADGSKATAAIVFAPRPDDPRSDHETAIVVTSFRRLNPTGRIAVEMVDQDNREHLIHAGSDALIDHDNTIANLLVRSVQDVGVSDVICELLASEVGSEIYRIPIAERWLGKPWLELSKSLIDEGAAALGLARGDERLLNPDTEEVIREGDEVFVVAPEPPHQA